VPSLATRAGGESALGTRGALQGKLDFFAFPLAFSSL